MTTKPCPVAADQDGALGRIAAEGRLAATWTTETAADWTWARIQPATWAHLVSLRGWDPGTFTERTIASLVGELITAGPDAP